MTNAVRQIRSATSQTVLTTAGTVANGVFSTTAITEFSNTSSTLVPEAPLGLAVLTFTFAVAPTAGSALSLFMVRKEVDGTADDTGIPSGAASNGADYMGDFIVNAVTTLQRKSIVIDLTGVVAADFYIRNGTGQTLNTGAVLKITPFTYQLTA